MEYGVEMPTNEYAGCVRVEAATHVECRRRRRRRREGEAELHVKKVDD